MARIKDTFIPLDDIVFSNRPGYAPDLIKWSDVQYAQTLLETQWFDPNFDHYTEHCYAAYEHYGRPFYCASIGDTMGNQIRIAALHYQQYPLHNEHVNEWFIISYMRMWRQQVRFINSLPRS